MDDRRAGAEAAEPGQLPEAAAGSIGTVSINEHIRYEADQRCPLAVAVGGGIQGVLIILAPVVVNASIVFRAAGQPESYVSWAVFAARAIVGVITALQAACVG